MKNIILGMGIIERFVDDRVQITEVNNCISICNDDHYPIAIPKDQEKLLFQLGWNDSDTYGWMYDLDN